MTRTTNEAIHSYVSDMRALENHIGTALKGQIEDFEDDHPAVATALREFHRTTQRHEEALRKLEDSREAGARLGIADYLKRAATTVAGAGAAVVDAVRSEKLPKNLRDDYTAFNLAAVGYIMLYTTARSLNDQRVATVAESHLQTYAGMTIALQELIPVTVIALLRSENLPVNESVLSEVDEIVRNAWRQKVHH